MAKVFKGRYTANSDEPVIVFTIGMRINRAWAVHKWWKPTVNTVKLWWHIQRGNRPDGYLNGYLYFYAWGVGMVQYWRDFDALEAFSHDREQPHLQAWRHLFAQSKDDTTFGYWHETYQVSPGKHEAIYGNMPRFGMAAATGHEPIGSTTEAARLRIDNSGT